MPEILTCNTCGRSWDNDDVGAPAGRCPWEADHVKPTRYRVVVIKRRTGERIEGTIQDDGLQSLWPVETADGERYVSVLDTFLVQEEI